MYILYIYIAGSSHQRLLAGFGNAAAACSCLQLPAQDTAPDLAWGRIRVPGRGSRQSGQRWVLDPRDGCIIWKSRARRLPIAFPALQSWKGPIKVG